MDARNAWEGDEMEGWKVLSLDMKICTLIYEMDEVRDEKVWLSKLVRMLEGEAVRATVSKTVDRLFDLGIVDGEWEKVDGKWTRVLRIAGEAHEFVEAVAKSVEIPQK